MSRTSSDVRARRGVGERARRLLALAIAGALAVVVAAGCGSSGGNDTGGSTTAASGKRPFTVGLMVLSLKQQFFVDQAKVVGRMVERLGGKLIVGDPDGDPTRQLQITQDWLNAGKVDAIVGSTVDLNAFQPALDLAEQKDVPVALIGFRPRQLLDRQMVVDIDIKEYGRKGGLALARCINERFGGRAEIAILGGPNLPGPVVRDRIAGIKEGVIEDAPSSEIVAEQSSDDQRLKSLQVTQSILQAHPDVTAFGSTGDDGMFGVAQALKNAGKDPSRMCLIGMSGSAEGFEAVRSGEFYAVADLNFPYLYDTAITGVTSMMDDASSPYSRRLIISKKTRMVFQ